MTERRPVATPTGISVLRRETPEDQPFLRALFDESRAEELRAGGLAPAHLEMLLAMQFRSQTATYAFQFPDARFWIVELDGERAGRLIEDDRETATHVVDIAIAATHQRRGLAGALLRQTQSLAAAAGRGVTANVSPTNEASRALFRALGFAESYAPGDAQLRMTWPAGG
jgi:ribosomal protein S18 acetylase RimI-like enzyme